MNNIVIHSFDNQKLQAIILEVIPYNNDYIYGQISENK